MILFISPVFVCVSPKFWKCFAVFTKQRCVCASKQQRAHSCVSCVAVFVFSLCFTHRFVRVTNDRKQILSQPKVITVTRKRDSQPSRTQCEGQLASCGRFQRDQQFVCFPHVHGHTTPATLEKPRKSHRRHQGNPVAQVCRGQQFGHYCQNLKLRTQLRSSQMCGDSSTWNC